MTFRQILAVLWQRRWVVVVIVLVAAIASAAYTSQQTPEYASTTTLRLSAVATSGQLQEQLGSVEVDLDSSAITSRPVLQEAARALGEPVAVLEGQVSYDVAPGELADQVIVTASAESARASRRRADAVAEAYAAYLAAQVETGVATLQERYDRSIELAKEYQDQVQRDSEDMIAAANLSGELARASALSAQLTAIGNAGAPAIVTEAARDGERQGTPAIAIIATALAAGLIAGVGLALIIDQFDTRIRHSRELERLAGAPLLAELPRDRKAAKSREPLHVAARAATPLNEGFRALRTSLQVLLPPERAIVVLTSVEPGDGKSFISARLAVAWARAGKSTILVGGDLRRPGLATYFGDAAEGEGLAELLWHAPQHDGPPSGEQIDALLRGTDVRGLRILPSGTADADTSDLLALPELDDVLTHLGASADIVLIDAPPSLALTDAALLAAHASGVVVIAAMHRTTRDRMTTVLNELTTNGATVLGVVANRSRRKLPASYAAYQRDTQTAARDSSGPRRTGRPEPAPDGAAEDAGADPADTDAR
ncbi:polysaccharide biosynthesis tyrosine autokinase [Microbacterium rhizophilus]|uniref:polysaccharide biosynthesis tyrosine autokinase n=1 Tax=Microbacterium rhizophilus TaxID=3138934 RepID=UPI0031F05AA5